ncbi:MAG: glycosyltransferase, partial [Lentisphaerae bacterium]|nr:glycosyltransferase [Lentisphaerota bacterium]
LHSGPVDRLRTACRAVCAVLPAQRLMQKPMGAALDEMLNTFQPDAVLVQFPMMAQYVTHLSGTRSVLDVVDLYAVSKYRKLREARGPRRLIALISWLLWIRYEARFYPRFDAVMPITEQDATGINIFYPGLNCHCGPLAVEIPEPAPRPITSNAPPTIGFVGWLKHPPNRDAVARFITRILPRVRAENPDVEFHVAGKGADDALLSLGDRGIVFHGFVDDLRAFHARMDVMVLPLTHGGGVKIKALEALAHGAAIVSTNIGIEGIGIEDGTHAIVRDGDGPFATAVIEVLRSPSVRDRLRAAAAAFAAKAFRWDAKIAHLERLLSPEHTGGTPAGRTQAKTTGTA